MFIFSPTSSRRIQAAIIAQILLAFSLPQTVCAQADEAGIARNANQSFEVQINGAAHLQSVLQENLDLFRFGRQLDSDQIARLYRAAPEQIRKILESEGYYQVQIRPSIERGSSPWRLRFDLNLGEGAKVNQIELRRLRGAGALPAGVAAGDAPLPDEEEVKSLLELSQPEPKWLQHWQMLHGMPFRHAEWESAKRALLREISLERHPRVQLRYSRASVQAEKAEADLLMILDPGPLVRFGPLQIEGLQRYPRTVVTNVNSIAEGDLYSEQALLDLQQRLQDSNYFRSVVVSAEFGDEGQNLEGDEIKVPVVVRLNEYKRKKVDAGIGYSTNTGNRLQLALQDLALWGMQAKSELLLETRKQSLNLDFTLPVSSQGWHDSFGANHSRSALEGEVSVQSRLFFHRRWGNPTLTRDFGVELINERKTLNGQPGTSTRALPLNYEVTWRKLDNLLQPRSGYVLQAKIAGAPLPMPGGKPFVQLSTRALWYQPLGRQNQLLVRAEVGALLSKDTEPIPSSYLFRAGGDQSVRGYAYQQLGVRDGDAITGGRYLATASLEGQHWFTSDLGAALFVDGGNAANQFDQLRPQLGYGAGARWRSPVGPINLDVAYGRAVRKVRLHFSLGLAF